MSDPQDTTPADLPDPDDVPKTSDQLDQSDQRHDAAAQEQDQAPPESRVDREGMDEEESEDVTLGGVAGQAGLGNG